MSTRDFSWGKGGWCVWLTTYHPRGAEASRKSGALTYPEPLGPPRPFAGWPLPNYCENMGKCKCNIIFGHVRIIGSLSGHLLYCPHPNNYVYIFCKEIMFWLIHICHPFTSIHYRGLFISPSGTSELDCATTKTYTAERSISIGRESLKVFFVLGALAYL